MYNQTYEEYIRSILGYPNYSMDDNCQMSFNQNQMPYMMTNNYNIENQESNFNSNNMDIDEIERCYPEIYKIVYPMVAQICRNNNGRITREAVEEMTDEIYSAMETNENEINLTINLQNEIQSGDNRKQSESRNQNNALNGLKENIQSSKMQQMKNTGKDEIVENRGEDRQTRNSGLRDLIKILIIRELLNRPGSRPPHGGRPPFRPPFPGGPGMPPPRPRPPHGGRPPVIMPRGIYEDIYEF